MAEELQERTIKHRAFRYFDEGPHPVEPDKTILRQRFARRGETVKLRAEDIRRGEQHDAFGDPNQPNARAGAATDDAGSQVANVAGKSDQQIVEWLEEEKPTVPQTIAAAGDDPELAQRILDAEYQVTGRDARNGVVEGLERIVEQDDDDDDDDDEDDD